jgi:hypothetical protein
VLHAGRLLLWPGDVVQHARELSRSGAGGQALRRSLAAGTQVEAASCRFARQHANYDGGSKAPRQGNMSLDVMPAACAGTSLVKSHASKPRPTRQDAASTARECRNTKSGLARGCRVCRRR